MKDSGLTEAQVRKIIAPWYSLFNVASRGDVESIHRQVVTDDYVSSSGFLPGETWDRENSIKIVGAFATSLPNLTFEIIEVITANDRVIVRGDVRGTPAGTLFGAPHTGKSFRMLAIDLHTLRDGKICRTYHMENWLSALNQLRQGT